MLAVDDYRHIEGAFEFGEHKVSVFGTEIVVEVHDAEETEVVAWKRTITTQLNGGGNGVKKPKIDPQKA